MIKQEHVDSWGMPIHVSLGHDDFIDTLGNPSVNERIMAAEVPYLSELAAKSVAALPVDEKILATRGAVRGASNVGLLRSGRGQVKTSITATR